MAQCFHSLCPCFSTALAGKSFYSLVGTGWLDSNDSFIPSVTGSRNFCFIFPAVTSCTVMALTSCRFAASFFINNPVSAVIVAQYFYSLCLCFSTALAGKSFYPIIGTGWLRGDGSIIPGMTGSRNFCFIFPAVTSCTVMALTSRHFAACFFINCPVSTVIVTQCFHSLCLCFSTAIAGKSFYSIIGTGWLCGDGSIIPVVTGSWNFCFIFPAVTTFTVMALTSRRFAASFFVNCPVSAVIVTGCSDFFCSGFAADGAGILLCTSLCTGWIYGYFSVVPVIFTIVYFNSSCLT